MKPFVAWLLGGWCFSHIPLDCMIVSFLMHSYTLHNILDVCRGENTFVVPEESVKNAWVRRETALEVHGLDVKDHWLAQLKL